MNTLYCPQRRSTIFKPSGFTLLEILVAITILALLGVMAYRGLDSVRSTSVHISKLTDHWQQLSHGISRMERDLRLSYGQIIKDKNGQSVNVWQGGTSQTNLEHNLLLSFLRSGEDGGDDYRVGYRLQDGQLEMLLWASGDDLGEQAPVGTYQLISNIKGMELTFMDESGNYLNNWPPEGTQQVPRAVRIAITVDEGAVERVIDLR